MTRSLGLLATLALIASLSAFARTVSVMSYNVENLFDNVHDQGKEDWTYLPLSEKQSNPQVQAYCKSVRNPYYKSECFNLDWSDAILDKKIEQVSKVIRAYDNGKGPDILIVQEVENLRVLTMLKDRGLKKMGYKEVVLIEGPDSRGIDVGMISRFPLARTPVLHKVDLSELNSRDGSFSRNTRGILEATFKIDGQNLTVFGNHWSSQSNIDATRLIAARTLFNAAKEIKDSAVIAAGDFNTVESDNPHGINEYILSEDREISFYDAVDPFADSKDRENNSFDLEKDIDRILTPPVDQGSHWYQGKWEYLDHIFLLKSTTATEDKNACAVHACVGAVWSSFSVHRPEFMLREITYVDRRTGTATKFKVPWRFDAKKGEGYSDHLPVAMKLVVDPQ